MAFRGFAYSGHMWLVPKQLMRREEGDTDQEWLLSRALGTCDALGTVTVWILMETTTVVWGFFAGSLGLEKLSGPKRSTSLLQWHMSQHESFRDYMCKSKHVCPTCAPTSLNEQGTKGKLWRLLRKSHNFQAVLQPEGKRAAGCWYVCDASQMKPCTSSNYPTYS